ncbi:Uncharacterized protein dnl_53080 [Desulfonema limicola]|uniref:Uncharacterized protein n=1 Tax=Desulfonema limicola TaxID=45656 RepID=A0A975BCN5_9BACT|nr:hypothetical protein [Desulfonema limicola]QTA82922.1 Uncharacterized protein dnl_53080 [Desulfonema limicola]
MKANKVKAVSAVFFVFFMGVIIGSMGTYIYVKQKIDKIIEKGPPPEIVPRLMKELSRKLDLTSRQKLDIEALARQMQTEISLLKEKHHPELEKIVEGYIILAKEKLNPDQQKQMDILYGRLKKRWHKPGWFGRHDKKGKLLFELKEKLNLNKDQEEQIQAIIREFYKNKSDEKNRFKKEIEIKLENILTPDQMKIYKNMNSEKPLN